MSADRELLELAAKATGRVGGEYCETSGDEPALYIPGLSLGVQDSGFWCPLTDDGDAMRLAVQLHFEVVTPTERRPDPRGPAASVTFPFANGFRVVTEWVCDNGGDANAATRRAIVRAAADTGSQA